MRQPANRRRYGARAVAAAGSALLLLLSSVAAAKSQPAFEFFVASGSQNDVPSVLLGTSAFEDSLNIEICAVLERLINVGLISLPEAGYATLIVVPDES